jgi:hypothetical protein
MTIHYQFGDIDAYGTNIRAPAAAAHTEHRVRVSAVAKEFTPGRTATRGDR